MSAASEPSPTRGRHADRPLTVVTGGSRGIGFGIAAFLHASGRHRVALLARDAKRLADAAARLDGAPTLAVDVTDEANLRRALEELQEGEGRPVEVLINNAGTAETAAFSRTSTDLMRRQFELNVVSVAVACQAVLPGMRQSGFGRIVNVASTASLKAYPYTAAYTSSKHALLGLTRALATELSGTGITANAVCPGYVRTDMVEASAQAIVAKTGKDVEDVLASMTSANPEGRFIELDEVAHTVAWLASPGASAITGQAIAVASGEV